MKVRKSKSPMGIKLILLIMNIGFILNVEANTVLYDDPCTTTDVCEPSTPAGNFENWEYKPKYKGLYIDLKEEKEIPTPLVIINCPLCDGNSTLPEVGMFTEGSPVMLATSIEKKTNNQYILNITNRQDYENNKQRNYLFQLVLPNIKINVILTIIDIDDESPSIMVSETPCTIKENFTGPSDCIFQIIDPDSDIVTYEIDDFSDIFEVKDDTILFGIDKTARLHLKKELDFEVRSMYSFKVTATDPSGNKGTAQVIIKVEDISDTAPIWITIFATKSFKEHDTLQEYRVFAKDGDLEIDASIGYKFDNKCNKNIYVNKDSSTKEGVITFGEIDRDYPEIEDNTIKCTITAFEEEDETWFIASEIIFVVQDINDNKPEITLLQPDICMNEGEPTQFDNIFSINDIDQGVNAQYEVSLLDSKYSKAFQIIPSNGFRDWDFSITVINPKLLDYDIEDWRLFPLTIQAKDKGSPVQEDKKIINVCLYNMNNNQPYFITSNFIVTIQENAAQDTKIIEILAADKDTDDYVLYEITMGQDKFKLDKETTSNDPINIYTKKSNIFDYEKQQEVYFQITIRDNLNSSEGMVHEVSQQITIKVQDVNDEKPRITLLSTDTPEIKEHSPTGMQIKDVLEAEDVDTKAELEFSIIWDETYAMKDGRKITDINKLKNVFEIVPKFSFEDGKENKRKATASLVVADKNKLDWEEFEILYLKIRVEDIKQEINQPGEDFATMAIILIDINDQGPVLVEPSTDFQVIEEANENILIGSVFATDKDGPGNNIVEYELKPINNTADDLIKIDKSSGEIRVNQNKKIDADCPKTWKLYYEVIAKDRDRPDLYDTKEIFITIDDINNKTPRLEHDLVPVSVTEGSISEENKPIIQVEAVDDDREDPHNVVIYDINVEMDQNLHKYFKIDEKGKVFVINPLVWQKGAESKIVHLLIKDNKGASGYNDMKTNFTINIIDIDDKKPILPEIVRFDTITEDSPEETIFATITANDEDQPCTSATEIEYKITKIMNSKNIEITEEIFRIDNKHYTNNDCVYYGNVVINKKLRDYYGNIVITVTATNPVPDNFDEKEYNFKITPYNFQDPNIIIPINKKIILSINQKINSILIQIDNKNLDDFKATDNQNDKYSMTFSLEMISGGDIFKIVNIEKSIAQLQLKQLPEADENIYKIKIKAEHDGTGNSKNYVEEEYDVYFLDKNQLPFFDKNVTLNIKENDTLFCGDLPEAIDPKCSSSILKGCVFTTYYHIMGTSQFFTIPNNAKSQLGLKEALDYEKQTTHKLTVVATNDENSAPPEEPPNALKITVNVIDVNDESPHFKSKLNLGGISSNQQVGSDILTISATDIDTVDIDKLRYEIVKDSMVISDNSLNSVKDNPFKVDSKTGIISNNFSPVIDMKGYFLFKVQVFDSDDLHNDLAEVKISLITDANRIAFTFNNDVESVKANRIAVGTIFTNELEYICSIDTINKKTESGIAIDNQTEVSTHFLNPENNEPVTEKDITAKTADTEIISRLTLRFEDIGLELSGIKKNVDEEIKNMENLLRILLIVVSVVLGTLIIILIIAFVLRTRSLKKRLESMTTNIFGSTKSNLNRIGTSAPGTNRHAVEANPVWNTNLNNRDQFDNISQTSGGSDLIGIEDNPEFQYNNRKDSVNPMYHNNNGNTSFENDDDDINSLPGSNI